MIIYFRWAKQTTNQLQSLVVTLAFKQTQGKRITSMSRHFFPNFSGALACAKTHPSLPHTHTEREALCGSATGTRHVQVDIKFDFLCLFILYLIGLTDLADQINKIVIFIVCNRKNLKLLYVCACGEAHSLSVSKLKQGVIQMSSSYFKAISDDDQLILMANTRVLLFIVHILYT